MGGDGEDDEDVDEDDDMNEVCASLEARANGSTSIRISPLGRRLQAESEERVRLAEVLRVLEEERTKLNNELRAAEAESAPVKAKRMPRRPATTPAACANTSSTPCRLFAQYVTHNPDALVPEGNAVASHTKVPGYALGVVQAVVAETPERAADESCICYFCGTVGHLAESCSEKRCILCAESGHASPSCPRREERCEFCRLRGHASESCPTRASRIPIRLLNARCLRCGCNGHVNCGWSVCTSMATSLPDPATSSSTLTLSGLSLIAKESSPLCKVVVSKIPPKPASKALITKIPPKPASEAKEEPAKWIAAPPPSKPSPASAKGRALASCPSTLRVLPKAAPKTFSQRTIPSVTATDAIDMPFVSPTKSPPPWLGHEPASAEEQPVKKARVDVHNHSENDTACAACDLTVDIDSDDSGNDNACDACDLTVDTCMLGLDESEAPEEQTNILITES